MAWKYILNEGESNCCGASVYENTDICSACKEHCEVVNLDEDLEPSYRVYQSDAWVQAQIDADEKAH